MNDASDDFELWPAAGTDHDVDLTLPVAAEAAARSREDALGQFPVAFPRASAKQESAAGLDEHERHAVAPPSRIAVWPIAVALLVGLAGGFAGGYRVAERWPRLDAESRPAPPPVSPVQPAAPAPSAREFTERSIPDALGDSGGDALPDTQRETSTVASQPDQSPALGRVLVRSTPADAQVLVDGRERGRTPATIQDLAPGAHRLRVVREGYASEERTIVVTTQQPSQSVTVNLEQSHSLTAPPPPSATASPTRTLAPVAPVAPVAPASDGEAVGALDVESRPIGAQVFLDDTLVGTTPFASARIPAGKHFIRLEYRGYRRWESPVSIVRNERNRITASLEQ